MSLDYGDPYIEWEEENYHRDDFEDHDFEGEDIPLEEPEPETVTIMDFLSETSKAAIRRFMKTKSYSEKEAVEYCINFAVQSADVETIINSIISKGKSATGRLDRKKQKMELSELKEAVSKLLISSFDFTPEEAEETVDASASDDPDMWSENADPDTLAKFLASDENDK